MDRTVKILLSVIAGLFAVCLCVSVVAVLAAMRAGRNVVSTISDPTQGAAAGQRIADYTLPDGYSQAGMRMFTFDMVMITNDSSMSQSMQYMLMQFPTNQAISQEEMRDQMIRQFEMQGAGSLRDVKVVDELTRTVRGQEVQFLVIEGLSTNDQAIRQMYGFFEGKSGQAMFSAYTSAQYWDQEHADAFMATFK